MQALSFHTFLRRTKDIFVAAHGDDDHWTQYHKTVAKQYHFLKENTKPCTLLSVTVSALYYVGVSAA
jgi:hypothetical protein